MGKQIGQANFTIWAEQLAHSAGGGSL